MMSIHHEATAFYMTACGGQNTPIPFKANSFSFKIVVFVLICFQATPNGTQQFLQKDIVVFLTVKAMICLPLSFPSMLFQLHAWIWC